MLPLSWWAERKEGENKEIGAGCRGWHQSHQNFGGVSVAQSFGLGVNADIGKGETLPDFGSVILPTPSLATSSIRTIECIGM